MGTNLGLVRRYIGQSMRDEGEKAKIPGCPDFRMPRMLRRRSHSNPPRRTNPELHSRPLPEVTSVVKYFNTMSPLYHEYILVPESVALLAYANVHEPARQAKGPPHSQVPTALRPSVA